MKAKGEEKERQAGMNISNIQGNFQPSNVLVPSGWAADDSELGGVSFP